MCARPRRVADYDLMNAALQVVITRGADHTRLADVAAASGLAPATLVQRFGSREGLLEAVAEAFLHDLRGAFQSMTLSPMENLSRGLASLVERGHLGFVSARPAVGSTWSLELRKQLAFCLISAVEQGELPHGDVAALARRIQIAFYGAATAAQMEGVPLNAEAIAALIGELTEAL
jgi:AcrR family transcriptional regulator